MQLASVDSLVDALRGRPILRPEQFAELMRDHVPAHGNTQELAKALIRLRWLTVYQAKKLIANKADELVIGPYVVLDKLGEGGMGKVYKATQLSLGRVVALKVVRAALLKNETALKRFLREVKAASDLTHPNIVRVFDADQIGDKHFLAMEYIQGRDLTQLVKDRGPLPLDVTCSYIRQVALGLQHAHDRKMVHRDIKPSNLIVAVDARGQYSAQNVVKILDMGLARTQNAHAAGEHLSTELTRTGTVIGTPDFMSPEQAKNSSAVDHRSDMYSLGCTFYYLLTGNVPFPIGTPLEKLLQHQMDSPRPIHLARTEVPPEVAAIVHCLLAKRPDQRFQSGGAVAHALERWCDSPGNAAIYPGFVPKAEVVDPASGTIKTADDPFDFSDEPLTEPEQVQEPQPDSKPARKPKFPLLLVIIGMVLVLLTAGIGVGIVLAMKKKSEDEPLSQESPKQDLPKSGPGKTAKHDPPVVKDLETIEKYLPNDTALVALFDLKLMHDSTAGQKYLLTPVAEKLAAFTKATGVDLLTAAERVVLAIVPEEKPGDVIVIQGRSLISAKLLEGIKTIPNISTQPARDGGPDIHKLGNEKALFGAASDTSIILSLSRDRILEALEKRDGAKRTKFVDPTITRGIEYAQSKPFAIFATLGLREGWARLLPMANKVNFIAIAATFEERGMNIMTLGDETGAGKVVELQRSLAKILEDKAKESNPPNLAVSHIAKVLTDAEPSPKPGPFAKNRRLIHLVHHIPARKLEEWFAPFVPKVEK